MLENYRLPVHIQDPGMRVWNVNQSHNIVWKKNQNNKTVWNRDQSYTMVWNRDQSTVVLNRKT